MVKIFLTGDNHFGRKFDKYPKEIKETIINERYNSFENMIKKANDENCNFFVVAGDLFENINVAVADVKKVIEYLKRFDGEVLVLPGNHDYYIEDETVWKTFSKNIESIDNIKLLNRYEPYEYKINDENIVFYPAFCDSKHSEENRLRKYDKSNLDNEKFNVLLAHGAIEGLSLDAEGKYFLMSEYELKNMGMDCCLIGHTHIPYPNELFENKDVEGYHIFNAGTHSQLDLHNNTDGECFIISLEYSSGKKIIKSRKFVSGTIRFFDIDINVKNETLKNAIENALAENVNTKDSNTIVRINLKGEISADDYYNKETTYEELLNKYLYYEKDDKELTEEITVEKIRKEFAETSFTANLLEKLSDPIEKKMLYELVKEIKN